MSTIAYAQLTNKREAASPRTSTTSQAPGVKTYIDALAALVPAEVLTLHGVIIGILVTVESGKAVLAEANYPTAQTAFWLLLALSVVLYAIPRYSGGKWDSLDWVRMLLAPVAFVAWTMLQPTTAFDALQFLQLDHQHRMVYALILGAMLAIVAPQLSTQADGKEPPGNPIDPHQLLPSDNPISRGRV